MSRQSDICKQTISIQLSTIWVKLERPAVTRGLPHELASDDTLPPTETKISTVADVSDDTNYLGAERFTDKTPSPPCQMPEQYKTCSEMEVEEFEQRYRKKSNNLDPVKCARLTIKNIQKLKRRATLRREKRYRRQLRLGQSDSSSETSDDDNFRHGAGTHTQKNGLRGQAAEFNITQKSEYVENSRVYSDECGETKIAAVRDDPKVDPYASAFSDEIFVTADDGKGLNEYIIIDEFKEDSQTSLSSEESFVKNDVSNHADFLGLMNGQIETVGNAREAEFQRNLDCLESAFNNNCVLTEEDSSEPEDQTVPAIAVSATETDEDLAPENNAKICVCSLGGQPSTSSQCHMTNDVPPADRVQKCEVNKKISKKVSFDDSKPSINSHPSASDCLKPYCLVCEKCSSDTPLKNLQIPKFCYMNTNQTTCGKLKVQKTSKTEASLKVTNGRNKTLLEMMNSRIATAKAAKETDVHVCVPNKPSASCDGGAKRKPEIAVIKFADILDANLIHEGKTDNRFIKNLWLQQHVQHKGFLEKVQDPKVLRRSPVVCHEKEEWESRFCERLNKQEEIHQTMMKKRKLFSMASWLESAEYRQLSGSSS